MKMDENEELPDDQVSEAEKERRLARKLIWQALYYVGIVYYLEHPNPKYKKLHMLLHGTVVCNSIIGYIGYLITTGFSSLSFMDFMYASIMMNGLTNGICLLTGFIIVFRKELVELVEYVDKNMTCNLYEEEFLQKFGTPLGGYAYTRKYNSAQVARWFNIVQILASLIFFLIPLTDTLFFCKSDQPMKNLQHHLIAEPFIGSIDSKWIYSVVYLWEVCQVFTVMIICMALSRFYIFVTAELNNAVHHYCVQIKFVSDAYLKRVEEGMRTRSEEITEREKKDFQDWCDWLETCMKGMINEHHKYLKALEPFITYMNIFGSLVIIFFFILLLGSIYITLTSDLETALKMKYLSIAITMYIYFFPFFEVGSLIHVMIDEINDQIYDIPWYYFPPKLRSQIHNWQLGMINKPTIVCYKVFTMNREFFPSVMKTIYSFGTILRNVA